MLEQREQDMHSKVSDEMSRKLKCLQQQGLSFQDKLHSTAGLIEYTREVLKEEQPAALLLTGASLDERLTATIDSCPPLQPNATEDFSHMILNLQEEKIMIQKMGLLTIKAPEKPRIGGQIEERNNFRVIVRHSPCMVESYEIGMCKSGGLWDYNKQACMDEKETEEYQITKANLDFDSEYFVKARLRNKAGSSGWSNVLSLRTPPKALTFKLDPQTAHEDLVIINGGRSVIYQPRPHGFWVMQQEDGKPDTGKFFGRALALLGDVTLVGDVHYWEVTTQTADKIGDDKPTYRGDCAIGLAKLNCNRGMSLGSEAASWALRIPSYGGNWYAAHKNRQYAINDVSVFDSCPRSQFPAGLHIGVLVDFPNHKLKFYDYNRKQLLHYFEFTHKDKKLCPAFEVSDGTLQLNVRPGVAIPDFIRTK
ncbi:FSD1-like protein [Glandiceps talaboti]